MSTGLAFGAISALYGLSQGIVSREQYSLRVAAVITTAVLPAAIATYVFFPSHLLHTAPMADEEITVLDQENHVGPVVPPRAR